MGTVTALEEGSHVDEERESASKAPREAVVQTEGSTLQRPWDENQF